MIERVCIEAFLSRVAGHFMALRGLHYGVWVWLWDDTLFSFLVVTSCLGRGITSERCHRAELRVVVDCSQMKNGLPSHRHRSMFCNV
jgi:hypothetical protein